MSAGSIPGRLLYDLDGASQQLSVSRRVVEDLVAAGEIASVKLGRRRLVPHDALEEYIERLRANA